VDPEDYLVHDVYGFDGLDEVEGFIQQLGLHFRDIKWDLDIYDS